jgi:molecular chaperone DnaJ
MASQSTRDYYEILGLSRDCTTDEIRAAYRKLARKYHPDVSKEADAETRFKEINEAYQVLSDADKRSRYDRFGHAGVQGETGNGYGGFGFGGFEDIFEDLFGFGMGQSARQGPHRGADLRYDLELTFEEAVFGCDKEIEIERLVTCSDCGGTGAEPGTSPIRCPECNGSGQIRRAQQSIFGSFVNVTTCPRCQGTGEVVTTPCSTCHGSRRVHKTQKIEVTVPAGVDDDMRIRLPGEGESGLYGGPPGNLYVILHVRPHEFFRRRDNDIILSLNVNVAQAALGDEITVPTLDGEEELTIPAGTQSGTTFRLRGKGVPYVRDTRRGDEVVIVNVAVPTSLNERQRELLQELGATLGSDITPQDGRGFMDRIKSALGL